MIFCCVAKEFWWLGHSRLDIEKHVYNLLLANHALEIHKIEHTPLSILTSIISIISTDDCEGYCGIRVLWHRVLWHRGTVAHGTIFLQRKKESFAVNICVVVQFYPWFKFYFSLFQTHYHILPYPKTKEKKFEPGTKLNHNMCILVVWLA